MMIDANLVLIMKKVVPCAIWKKLPLFAMDVPQDITQLTSINASNAVPLMKDVKPALRPKSANLVWTNIH